MKKILSTLILSLFVYTILVAQTDSTKLTRVQFNKDFKFKDGIFLNIEDVKRNNPILKTRLITDLDYDDYSFFKNLLKQKVISILDKDGRTVDLETGKIWGFSQNGMLFINWNDEFNRIPVFGSLCHFIADKTYIENDRSPFYNSYGYYYNPYYYPGSRRTVKTELRQYIIDMETGKIMDYNCTNLEAILVRDAALYEEFVKLKRKKKRQLKFLYLRKYNEKHPFYFYK